MDCALEYAQALSALCWPIVWGVYSLVYLLPPGWRREQGGALAGTSSYQEGAQEFTDGGEACE